MGHAEAGRTHLRNMCWNACDWVMDLMSLGTWPRAVRKNRRQHCRRGHEQRSGYGTMLQAGRSLVRGPMRSMNSFSLPNPSGHTGPWGSLIL
jgi:hypothetical protein